MNKRQIIRAILDLNHHATEAFLRQFGEPDLDHYLSLLRSAAAGVSRQRRSTSRDVRTVV